MGFSKHRLSGFAISFTSWVTQNPNSKACFVAVYVVFSPIIYHLWYLFFFQESLCIAKGDAVGPSLLHKCVSLLQSS